ncbi:MAG: hypothetical protein MJK18_05080, partial [Bdellovibrionales bacterium]|nr:hypothetical protein [Bdellovibrionales bacterium]
ALSFIALNELDQEQANIFLHLARFFGVLTPFTAVGFALQAAYNSYKGKRKIKRWTIKTGSFVVVSGDTREAVDLSLDLERSGYKVLRLTMEESNEVQKLQTENILKRTYVPEIDDEKVLGTLVTASTIYLMDSEDENLRLALKLDHYHKEQETQQLEAETIFAHVKSPFKTGFLYDSVSKGFKQKLKPFNIHTNTVRRLLNHFPIDRIKSEKGPLSIHIAGMNELSKELLHQLYAQLHLEKEVEVQIQVYLNAKNEQEEVLFEQFKTSLPNHNVNDGLDKYVWGNWTLESKPWSSTVSFEGDFYQSVAQSLAKSTSVSIYLCSDDVIETTSWLANYLPRLNEDKKRAGTDLRIFNYYDHPDRNEEYRIERLLNKLAPNTFVKCFGNLLDECTYEALHDQSLDELAILIDTWYRTKPGEPLKPSMDDWNELSFQMKRSNRQAADHIWLKLRWLIRNVDTEISEAQQLIKLFNQLEETDLILLGEIEHRRWSADLLLQGF